MANLGSRGPASPQGAVGILGKVKQTGAGEAATRPRVERIYQDLVLPQLGVSPRLLNGRDDCGRSLSPGDLESFCALLSESDFSKSLDFLEAAAARGVDFDSLLLGLLAGAARQLGLDWASDRLGFSQVTVGMSRLQQALQHMSMRDPTRPLFVPARGRALLAPCPGEQHNFAVMLIESMFHRAGWHTCALPVATKPQLGRLVARSAFDVITLSADGEERLPALAETIGAIRHMSRNQNIKILVGGNAFTDKPDLARRVNADAAPQSLAAALSLAEGFIAERQGASTFSM